jgi:hypothetical protein
MDTSMARPVYQVYDSIAASLGHCWVLIRTCDLLLLFLQDNCGKFVSNMQQLQDSVAKYVAAIDQQVSTQVASCSAHIHFKLTTCHERWLGPSPAR